MCDVGVGEASLLEKTKYRMDAKPSPRITTNPGYGIISVVKKGGRNGFYLKWCNKEDFDVQTRYLDVRESNSRE